jgi:hypothetical protein
MSKRLYATWRSDLSSNREYLFGYDEELVASIHRRGGTWVLRDRNGKELAMRKNIEDIRRLGTELL